MGSKVVRQKSMLPGFVSDSGTSGKGRWALPEDAPTTIKVRAYKNSGTDDVMAVARGCVSRWVAKESNSNCRGEVSSVRGPEILRVEENG